MKTQEDMLNYIDLQKQLLMKDTTMKLQPKQKEMIEKVLYPSDFLNINISVRESSILLGVLMEGEYTMEEKVVLNRIRKLYLHN